MRYSRADTGRQVADALSAYQEHRRRTLDLLGAAAATRLLSRRLIRRVPLWKSFRHVGRVQEDYLRALRTGYMEFVPQSGTYGGGSDGHALVRYLRRLDRQLQRLVQGAGNDFRINWFGKNITLEEHIRRLTEHELIHHGQWILVLGWYRFRFPASWRVWGVVTSNRVGKRSVPRRR